MICEFVFSHIYFYYSEELLFQAILSYEDGKLVIHLTPQGDTKVKPQKTTREIVGDELVMVSWEQIRSFKSSPYFRSKSTH